MEIIYSGNLITNGKADSLDGWTGQATVINNTFKVATNTDIQQKVILNTRAKKLRVTAEYLPDDNYNSNNGYGDVSVLLHCTKHKDIVVIPNRIE